ncbi:hypothetical protein R3P38DRAFT_2771146 [Favolaschia claudopus]|uniref:Uncharacterized protein n=1 Tax=Favolaschia claudopus TaxID=2862362 RepID=A0AAW0BV33_9AGAR
MTRERFDASQDTVSAESLSASCRVSVMEVGRRSVTSHVTPLVTRHCTPLTGSEVRPFTNTGASKHKRINGKRGRKQPQAHQSQTRAQATTSAQITNTGVSASKHRRVHRKIGGTQGQATQAHSVRSVGIYLTQALVRGAVGRSRGFGSAVGFGIGGSARVFGSATRVCGHGIVRRSSEHWGCLTARALRGRGVVQCGDQGSRRAEDDQSSKQGRGAGPITCRNGTSTRS